MRIALAGERRGECVNRSIGRVGLIVKRRIASIRNIASALNLNQHVGISSPYIGSRARVAEVLNHKRSLTLPMIRRLHAGLGIPAEVLIRA